MAYQTTFQNIANRITDADTQGREAYAAGVKFSDCPHAKGSDERIAWQEGWLSVECRHHLFGEVA